MKKPQWITVVAGLILTLAIFVFGRTIPHKTKIENNIHGADDGHNHDVAEGPSFSIDSILQIAKKQLKPEQVDRITTLESAIAANKGKSEELHAYHALSNFWGDSIGLFQPYAWYYAEAARLENSEKTLTFAARLFLEDFQGEQNPALRQWEALQAKDLFERSLIINPANDSAKVGIGACYLFGNISAAPMAGIEKIREVVSRDSTNVYAQLMLAKGSVFSGQLDKALNRLETVIRIQPENIEAILMLADVSERTGQKKEAARWYEESLKYIKRQDAREDIRKRIVELRK